MADLRRIDAPALAFEEGAGLFAVFANVTVVPLIWPFTAPQMRTASPEIEPRTSAPSPTVIERLTTSPSMVPSIWMSPLQIRSPLILRSGLMIDGAAAREVVAARDGSAAGAGLGTLLGSFGR